MNTDREDLRLLITEFNDGPMGSADDFAWRRHLKTYEDLLAEVKRLREQGRKLIEAAEKVRSDINDQDTGWYYQLGNHIEKMNRLVVE